MSHSYRSACDKFRCGVAPLRLETGRYEGLPVKDRKRPFCPVHVESEMHVLLKCEQYTYLRENLFHKAIPVRPDFNVLSDNEKFIFLFSNQNMIRACSKACWLILQRR